MGKVILVIVFVVYCVLCISGGSNESDSLLQQHHDDNHAPRESRSASESELLAGRLRKKDHQNRRSRGHRQKSNKDGKTGCLLMVITSYYDTFLSCLVVFFFSSRIICVRLFVYPMNG